MNRLTASLALAALPFAALADSLFDQPSATPDGYYAYASSLYGTVTSADGPQYQAEADDFRLAARSVVSSITFYGGSDDYLSADLSTIPGFEISILDASLNAVYRTTAATGTLAAVATGATNVALGREYALTLSGLSLDLPAGTYFLSVGGTGLDDGFVWSLGANGDGGLRYDDFDGNGFVNGVGDLAFRIDGVQAVPEPASVAGFGLAALALVRRRR